MKLLRHGLPGQEKPAMVDENGLIRDLSGVLNDITPATLAPAEIARLRALPVQNLPVIERGPWAVPWRGLGQFIAIGLNYADHAAEAGMAIPKEPILFMKAHSCAVGAEHPIVLPQGSEKSDWEVELGVVIGTRARYVTRENALNHVAGYCVVNDVSERAFQMERGGQWDKGKGCPTFGPIGPWLVTRDEVADPQNLRLWLDLNGERMQDGNTRTMIFDVASLVSYVSEFMTLNPGDLITTGTPPGVGMGLKPQPRYLRAGDHLQLGIEGLGEQSTPVVAWNPDQID